MLRKFSTVAVLLFGGALLGLTTLVAPRAEACPFCSAQQMTLSEEIKSNDMTVLCKLVARPKDTSADASLEDSECTFEVVHALKGNPAKTFKVLYYGEQPLGTTFLCFGIDPVNPAWGTPVVLNERSIAYVKQLPQLPDSGADRLNFFQTYFEDSDPLLAADAYDEFAKAPYSELVDLKERMPREKLLSWISDKNVTTSRRRLYLCMLSVCGKPEDVPMLENLIKNEDRSIRTALDAMIGSYLALKGPDGMPLIENLFLKNADAEYTDTYSAIMALRFIGQETQTISRDRLIEAMRHMLSRPKLADLIIPDLTRWQDWTVINQLADLFKNADEESSWVRVPVVNYLRACPLPEAQVKLAELEKIDPDAVRRAALFFPAAAANPPQPTPQPTTEPQAKVK